MDLGKCVHEIAEHNHYVQGVAWDPLNEYIATQSSDRSMHVYRISTKQGSFEAHAVGKNTRMFYNHNHSRTPSSHGHSRSYRHESIASDVESTISDQHKEDVLFSGNYAPPTPTASVVSTPSTSMFPPPLIERPSSRRSSFSGSNAPGSPAHHGRYGRSPSPMPPLPAIRALPSPAWSTIKLYGDESFTNFFRRLAFSPDGGLLLTPAGQFEDPAIITNKPKAEETPTRGRKSKLSIATSEANPTSASSVFIYSRANFARPPIAQLPGHKKASVAVKFSPVLYELRQDVGGADGHTEPKTGTLEKGKDGSISLDIAGSSTAPATHKDALAPSPTAERNLLSNVEAPTPRALGPESLIPSSSLKHTPSPSKPSTPAITPPTTGSVFALPYRMLYAVLTMDAVAIYDTQQSGPVCMLTKLHYDEFTDASWYVLASSTAVVRIKYLTGLLTDSALFFHRETDIARL